MRSGPLRALLLALSLALLQSPILEHSTFAQAAGPEPSSGALEANLVFNAEPGCPSVAAFRDRFAELTKRVKLVDGVTARGLEVRIWREGRGFKGRVRAAHLELDRQLAAEVCADAINALALVAAIAFDPNARLPDAAAPVAGTAPSEPTSTASPTPTATENEGEPAVAAQPKDEKLESPAPRRAANERPAPQLKAAAVTQVDVPPTAAPEVAGESHSELAVALGLGPLVRVGSEPGVGLGAQLDLSLAGAGPWWRGQFGISGSRAERNFELGIAKFSTWLVHAAWCPEIASGAHFGTAFCAGAQGGVLVTEASSSARLGAASASVRPHAAAFAGLALSWHLASHWRLVLRANALGVLIQDRFAVETDQDGHRQVFESGALGGETGLSLQYEL